LFVDFLRGHPAAEKSSRSEVAAVARIRRTHHVLGVEHLLRELRHGQSTILLTNTRRERREACHEEVQSREGYEIDCDLAQIAVQLPWETEASCNAAHCSADKVVQVPVSRRGQLQRSEADVIQSLVIEQEAFVRVLNQLVKGKNRIIWLMEVLENTGRRGPIVYTLTDKNMHRQWGAAPAADGQANLAPDVQKGGSVSPAVPPWRAVSPRCPHRHPEEWPR